MNAEALRRWAAYAAADALVATHYGVAVAEIEVSDHGAEILRGNGGTRAERAALDVAGQEGQRLLGLATTRQRDRKKARADARAILETRRLELATLAARFERERTIVFRAT